MGGWLAWARPPYSVLILVWFGLLALVGVLLPGPANQLSLARAYLAAPAVIYALQPSGLGSLALVVALAGLTDLLDGMIARRLRQPTRLGGALDPAVDGVFFGVTALALAAGGAYPIWLAGVVMLRYGLPVLAGGALVLAGRPVVLRHTPLGQVSTAIIAIVLGGVALLRGLGLSGDWLIAMGTVAIPLSALATWANLLWTNRGAVIGAGSNE
jgi:cardiolipin synthase